MKVETLGQLRSRLRKLSKAAANHHYATHHIAPGDDGWDAAQKRSLELGAQIVPLEDRIAGLERQQRAREALKRST